jgi:hypothetical protein
MCEPKAATTLGPKPLRGRSSEEAVINAYFQHVRLLSPEPLVVRQPQSTPVQGAGVVMQSLNFRLDVANRDYHYLSRFEIAAAKRISRQQSYADTAFLLRYAPSHVLEFSRNGPAGTDLSFS